MRRTDVEKKLMKRRNMQLFGESAVLRKGIDMRGGEMATPPLSRMSRPERGAAHAAKQKVAHDEGRERRAGRRSRVSLFPSHCHA